jgi:HlyD family secretion protein
MTATVTIDVASVPDVLRVPNGALRFKPDTATGGGAATTSGGRNASATTSTSTSETTSTQTATTSTGPSSARFRNRQNGQTSTGGSGMTAEERAARFGNRTPGVGGAAGALGAPPVARKRPQTVYILGADNKLTAVEIRTGITDGHYTQVVSGDLKPGDNVVIGLATSKVDSNPPPGANNGPMGGRPGAAGGGRGGR